MDQRGELEALLERFDRGRTAYVEAGRHDPEPVRMDTVKGFTVVAGNLSAALLDSPSDPFPAAIEELRRSLVIFAHRTETLKIVEAALQELRRACGDSPEIPEDHRPLRKGRGRSKGP